MKLYLAANFRQRDYARQVMDRLEAAGHTITHDWTGEAAPPSDPTDLATFRRNVAIADHYGVRNAEALVLLDGEGLKGAYVEMGFAIERGIPVLVVGCHYRQIFYEMPGVFLLDDIDEALAMLQVLR